MPRKRTTDTSKIAEWVGDQVYSSVDYYVVEPSLEIRLEYLKDIYKSLWSSIIEVYEQSNYRIDWSNIIESVEKACRLVAYYLVSQLKPYEPEEVRAKRAERIAGVLSDSIVIYLEGWRIGKYRYPKYERDLRVIEMILTLTPEELE